MQIIKFYFLCRGQSAEKFRKTSTLVSFLQIYDSKLLLCILGSMFKKKKSTSRLIYGNCKFYVLAASLLNIVKMSSTYLKYTFEGHLHYSCRKWVSILVGKKKVCDRSLLFHFSL